ncbi:MAG: PASTA domain-containing protein [Planctomycetes bacterium]|nr:PASTA domain-containing protein [Planctomycetota bacterium]MCB9824322.1 PASTA domain-containing protein [Planctomycetota bacterium]MCB9900319.1 PASTA domain-containing protein [Planctomycetota bacterium]
MSPRTLVALALAVCAWVAWATPAHAETVPDVIGIQVTEAEQLLRLGSFRISVQYDPNVPLGTVVAQDPPGFADRPRGTVVRIVVGGTKPLETERPPAFPPASPTPDRPDTPVPPPTEVPTSEAGVAPALAGYTLEEARRLAGSLPLRYERTLGVPELENHVVFQWPVAGEPLPAGQALTLVIGVSEMPSERHAVVPDVTGLDRDAAESVLREAGFGARADPTSRGRVLIHHPLPESLAIVGSLIELEIDAGDEAPADPVPPASDSPPAMPGRTPTPPASVPAEPSRPAPPSLRAPARPPMPRSPAESDTYPGSMPVLFDWESVSGTEIYDWQLLREYDGGVVRQVERTRVDQMPFQRVGLQRGRYLWRVRAVNRAGAGPWGPARQLFIY